MTGLVSHPLVQALGWTLLHFLWQGVLVGLFMALGLRGLRSRSAQARYVLACGGLLAMAILPIATFAILAGVEKVPGTVEMVREAGYTLVSSGPGTRLQQAQSLLGPVLPWALGLWLLGVSALTLRMLGAWFWLQGLRYRQASPAGAEWHLRLSTLQRRLGITRTVALLKSAAVEVPLVLGWLRPVLLVPTSAFLGLSPEALEAVLAHELAHIRRHDYLVNLIQSVIEILLFYHPAVWWLSAQIRTERENCCDDVAVAYCGDALAYAKALAALESLREPAFFRTQLALAANGGSLMQRIQRLILPSLPPSPTRRLGLMAVLAVSALGAGTVLHLKEDAPTPKAPAAPAGKAEKTTLVVVDGPRKLRVKSRGSVDLKPEAPELLTLAEGASFELRLSKDGHTKTFRTEKDAKGETRTYQEDGETKPFDATAKAWVKEELKEIQKAKAQAPAPPPASGAPAGPGHRVHIVEVEAGTGKNLHKRIVIDTEKITKEVEQHLKEMEKHQGEMDRALRESERHRSIQTEKITKDVERHLKQAEKHRGEMERAIRESERHRVMFIGKDDFDEVDMEDAVEEGLEGAMKDGNAGATPRPHIVVKRVKRSGAGKQEAEILRSTIEKLQQRLDRLEAQEGIATPPPPPRAPRAPRSATPPPAPSPAPAPSAPQAPPAPKATPAPPAPPTEPES